MEDMKIAVLIDAENISSKYASIILQEASSMGNLIYKRIYGNWTTPALNTWKKELLDNAIQPIQQYSNTVGKNSSDSALIIDAMDLLYQKRLDAFCFIRQRLHAPCLTPARIGDVRIGYGRAENATRLH